MWIVLCGNGIFSSIIATWYIDVGVVLDFLIEFSDENIAFRSLVFFFVLWRGVFESIVIFSDVFRICSDAKYGLIVSEAVGNVSWYENVELNVNVVVTESLTFLCWEPHRKSMMKYKLVCSVRLHQVVCRVCTLFLFGYVLNSQTQN